MTKLSDLLPIPDGVTKPNAYEVFGLQGGERDNQVVSAAVKKTYAALKAAKEASDPATWKQAAKMVELARRLLADPEQRRELDARLGVDEAKPDSASVLDDDDPLAAVLPGVDPLSGTMSSTGSSPAILGTPPLGELPGSSGLEAAASPVALGTPPLGTPPAAVMAGSPATQVVPETVVANSPAPQAWAPQKPSGRRRKKKSGVVLFTGFLVVMFAAIGGILFFLSQGRGLTIGQQSPSGLQVADPPTDDADPRDVAPERPKLDGVMGGVGQSGLAPSLRGDGGPAPKGSGLSGPRDMREIETPALPDPMNQGSMTEPDSGMNLMQPEPPSDPEPAPQPSMEEERKKKEEEERKKKEEERKKANEAKIAAVIKQIQDGDWENMKASAESLSDLELDPEQVPLAEALYDIADLATFYRGAVARGLATLKTGATFEFGGLDVLVVEVTSDQLTIRYDRKSKTFTLDQMPPRLMEKLAEFSLAKDRPDSIAGLALYRLIRSDTGTEYKVDAFEKLATVEGIENVDAVKLLNVAQDILAE